jgi:hypothetical protein
MKEILAPISLGELMDKITILEIKCKHLQGRALHHVRTELQALEKVSATLDLEIDPELIEDLRQVNQSLWRIEDAIREQESRKTFGDEFIQLARLVYRENDQRAAIKKAINARYGSSLIEEKSYRDY